MKHSLLCLFLLILVRPAMAVVTNNAYYFSASTLPSHIGDYNRSYYSTNNAYVASMVALYTNTPGGLNPPSAAQIWDFSQPQQPTETVLRTDIIGPGTSPDPVDFPAATYAEKDTLEPANQIAWRYYSITNLGRYYYGFDEPVSAVASSAVVFDQPTIDIPANVGYGSNWSRTVTWGGTVEQDIFNYIFTTSAQVDAYGTLILPGIGRVPAVRVHEIQDYQAQFFGSTYDDQTVQYYYWLVPGLGVAVQILQTTDNSGYSSLLSYNNAVERMFYANYFTPPPSPLPTLTTGNLHIQLQGTTVQLNWLAFTNTSYYLVEANGAINTTNWQILNLTTATNWSETISNTRRFYRVVGLP